MKACPLAFILYLGEFRNYLPYLSVCFFLIKSANQVLSVQSKDNKGMLRVYSTPFR